MTVSDQVIAILDELCRRFGIVIDWTGANVLPYLEGLCAKLISYEIWTSVTWIAIFFVLSVAAWIIAKFVWKKNIDTELNMVVAVVFAFIILAAIIVTCEQVFDIVTCSTIPEKIIFEQIKYIASTLK